MADGDRGLLKTQLASDLVHLADLQRKCVSISATLQRIQEYRKEAGYWDNEERDDFQTARGRALDAGDIIHQLAVGTVLKLQALKEDAKGS